MLKLPSNVIDQRDVVELIREIDDIDNFMHQAKLRKSGSHVKLPHTSRLLEDIAKASSVNLLHEDERKALKAKLNHVKEHSPVMHISFASEPPAAFIKRIVEWFRSEVHEHALVQVGLQPNIAAGCMLRTNNHYYDMSLRRGLDEKSNELTALIRAEQA